jgi:hypothetical protein
MLTDIDCLINDLLGIDKWTNPRLDIKYLVGRSFSFGDTFDKFCDLTSTGHPEDWLSVGLLAFIASRYLQPVARSRGLALGERQQQTMNLCCTHSFLVRKELGLSVGSRARNNVS